MGKTAGYSSTLDNLKKHPHVHGEDIAVDVDDCTNSETPPRAWGRQLQY